MKNNFWENDIIRLRAKTDKDSEYDKIIGNNIYGLSLVGEEMPLPYVFTGNQEIKAINPAAPGFVIETLNSEFVGFTHFNYINERHGTFSIGMILCENQRGKGYGLSAMKLLLKYAFEERRLNKFSGFCLDDNIASANMMKKLGCVREGIAREEVYFNGRFHDRLLFGLTAKEYFEEERRKLYDYNKPQI